MAKVLRSSLFLSSILLNSEAWGYLSQKNIRKLEQMDENLLSRVLDCASKTSNTIKYLELGVYPIRFEIMKRSVVFLQYILKQEKSSMIYQVLKATLDNPTKNDFGETCKQYLSVLDIKLSLIEMEKMTVLRFKNLVKDKTEKAAFKYLLSEKEKQTKISNIKYEKLEIQRYLSGEGCNVKLAKLIFKAKSQTLDIKTHRKWKYSDNLCSGCKLKEETGQEILVCKNFKEKNNDSTRDANYSDFYSIDVSDIVKTGKILQNNLRRRQEILESGVT